MGSWILEWRRHLFFDLDACVEIDQTDSGSNLIIYPELHDKKLKKKKNLVLKGSC